MSGTLDEDVHADLDCLLDAYLQTALPLLQKDKLIIAMGMKLSMANEASFIALHPKGSTTGMIDMEKHLRAYRQLLHERSERDGKAVLLAYDVHLKEGPFADGINIELEHMGGARITLLLPYAFTGLFKRLKTGEMQRLQPDTAPIM